MTPYLNYLGPGRIAQSVGHLTCKSEVLGSIPRSGHILLFLFPLIQEGQLSVTGKSMCTEVLVNRLGGLSLSRKSVVRLTDRPDMTLDKATTTTTKNCLDEMVQMRLQHGFHEK